MDIGACTAAQFQHADADLNAYYRKLLGQPGGHPGLLRKAQRA
jgi:uncharacterized protein YecT (DUF1311 family)